ncbi:hypothetical protein NQZ68_030969 [Dissostichus eleginoides]|nr:hypothetical protein NQZ68_030969 [Dissostichus eleginoides]
MDKGKREMREGTECQRRKRGRGYFAVQPPSIWPPSQQTALSALKSLAVLCPMSKPGTERKRRQKAE